MLHHQPELPSDWRISCYGGSLQLRTALWQCSLEWCWEMLLHLRSSLKTQSSWQLPARTHQGSSPAFHHPVADTYPRTRSTGGAARARSPCGNSDWLCRRLHQNWKRDFTDDYFFHLSAQLLACGKHLKEKLSVIFLRHKAEFIPRLQSVNLEIFYYYQVEWSRFIVFWEILLCNHNVHIQNLSKLGEIRGKTL